MSGINKVILLGRLVRDPEVKQLDSGPVCNFSVATSDEWTDKTGTKQEKAEFHQVATFGKLAEVCGKYLTKGRQVYLEGKLNTRSWMKDDIKHYATGINADKVEFLGDGQKDKLADKPETTPTFREPTVKAAAPTKPEIKNHAPSSDEMGF